MRNVLDSSIWAYRILGRNWFSIPVVQDQKEMPFRRYVDLKKLKLCLIMRAPHYLHSARQWGARVNAVGHKAITP